MATHTCDLLELARIPKDEQPAIAAFLQAGAVEMVRKANQVLQIV